MGEPHIIIPKYLDIPGLISWLSARQLAPEGGFAGRTNKLVDGCYSHWVGGCWPLIEACISGPIVPPSGDSNPLSQEPSKVKQKNCERFLYSREGLIRYILCCCQDTSRRGGLRDKPGMSSDPYHSCYVLAGLSSAQHIWSFGLKYDSSSQAIGGLPYPYQWTSKIYSGPRDRDDEQIFDEVDRVETVHPVFVIPEGIAERMKTYFSAKGSF